MKNIFAILKTVIFLFLVGSSTFAKNYWSGEVRTNESFLYGRIEVRMKSASAGGVTSTLFTYNTKSSTYNEIDIEIMGKDNNEAQYTTFTPDQSGVNHREVINFNPHAAFHVHAIEWTPDYVAWFVDGCEVHRDNSDRIKSLSLPQAIMMNFWMPNSVDWAGTFNDSSIPLYAMYDWIKYYEYTPGVNNNFTLKWSDDFNTFDNNRWVKSASTFGSNLCDFKPQNVLLKDGYLLLCMTKENQVASYPTPVIDKDIDAPYPMSGWIFKDQMLIEFSEAVDKVSAENTSNYIMLGLTLSNPTLLTSKRKILFTVAGATSATTYPAAYCFGIKDLAPTPNSSGLKKINLQSAHALPLVVDIGNNQTVVGGALKEQKWDEAQEYGSIGGSIKQESGLALTGDYASLYNTGVEGITFYRNRLHNGKYSLKLFFVETEKNSVGARVFDIYINGKIVISNLDIYKEVGTNNACEKIINGIQIDENILEVYFKAKNGLPILHGIMIEEDTTTSVGSDKLIPDHIGLQSYPNPFNSTTNIKFSLPKQTDVNLSIFDGLGRMSRKLASGQYEAGEYVVNFTANNLSSGIYYIFLNTSAQTISEKIVLLK
ncbi:MAG: family 16 glycosylhydrolase [Ignavibacteriaceae bacterium]|jgi:hypothetical protein